MSYRGMLVPDLPWVLVGGGGHARSVYDVLQRRGDVVAGLCADSPRPCWLPEHHKILPLESLAEWPESVQWLVAIGDPIARDRLTAILRATGQQLGTLVAETATVARDAQLGEGVMVMEHAHVGPGAVVGTSTIINTSSIIEHDCRVGKYTHIAPRAVLLGSSVIGDRVLVGASAVVLGGIRAGDDVIIGAHAAVTRSVDHSTTVCGVPARQLRPSSHGKSAGSSDE